jgi:outer membrane protein OmpA-like peptidoglycan-associated protein
MKKPQRNGQTPPNPTSNSFHEVKGDKTMSTFKPPLNRAFRWALLAQLVAVTPAMAESCADLLGKPGGQGGAPSGDCSTYGECMDMGRQSLRNNAPAPAIKAFKKALAEAGQDPDMQGDAYGCLGVAYEAGSDKAEAQANLEKARSVTGRKLAWVEDEYKRLLSSQKIVTAEDIERKLKADQEINQTAQTNQAEPPLQTAQGENSEDSVDMGSDTRGFAIATVEEPGKYTPKPAAGKPKPKAAAPHVEHRPAAHRRTSGSSEPAYSAPSLDLRINFEFGSAELTADGRAQADELGKALEKILADGRQQAVLVGHTDLIGSDQENERLSDARAASVKAYLMQNFPSLAGKLQEKGMGMRQPLYREMDEATQRLNRRVEVKLVQTSE